MKCGGVLQCKTVQNETDRQTRQTVDLKDSVQSFQSASVSFKRFIGIYIEFPVPSSFLFYIWQPNMTHWRGEKKTDVSESDRCHVICPTANCNIS